MLLHQFLVQSCFALLLWLEKFNPVTDRWMDGSSKQSGGGGSLQIILYNVF
jgi:hypothetical protein